MINPMTITSLYNLSKSSNKNASLPSLNEALQGGILGIIEFISVWSVLFFALFLIIKFMVKMKRNLY